MEENIDWEYLIKATDGYSGADIANVCREAALMPLRRILQENTNLEEIAKHQSKVDLPISMEDLKNALENISKSVSSTYLESYKKWMNEFGSK